MSPPVPQPHTERTKPLGGFPGALLVLPRGAGGAWGRRRDAVPFGPSQVIPCHVGPGARPPVVRTLRGGSRLLPASGRSAPGGCLPAASISPVRNGGKNTRGESFSPLDSPLWFGISFGVSRFFCGLACGPASNVGRGPPPGWAGWEAWVGGRRERARKIQPKNILPKESFQIRARTWGSKKTTTAPLRLYPKRGSEPQRAVLFQGVQGGTPCDSLRPGFL